MSSLICATCEKQLGSFSELFSHKGKCGVQPTAAERQAKLRRQEVALMEALARRERVGAAPPPPREADDPLRPRLFRIIPREIENIILGFCDGRALRKAQAVAKDWRQRCSVCIADRERLLVGPWTAPGIGVITLWADRTFIGTSSTKITGRWFTCCAMDPATEHEVEMLQLRGVYCWSEEMADRNDAPFIKSVPIYRMTGDRWNNWTRGSLPNYLRQEMDAVHKIPVNKQTV